VQFCHFRFTSLSVLAVAPPLTSTVEEAGQERLKWRSSPGELISWDEGHNVRAALEFRILGPLEVGMAIASCRWAPPSSGRSWLSSSPKRIRSSLQTD
jgi:hypothetical protein